MEARTPWQIQKAAVQALYLREMKTRFSSQLWVNRETKDLGSLIDSPNGEQALKPKVLEQLQELAKFQAIIQQGTYDLAKGKTK